MKDTINEDGMISFNAVNEGIIPEDTILKILNGNHSTNISFEGLADSCRYHENQDRVVLEIEFTELVTQFTEVLVDVGDHPQEPRIGVVIGVLAQVQIAVNRFHVPRPVRGVGRAFEGFYAGPCIARGRSCPQRSMVKSAKNQSGLRFRPASWPCLEIRRWQKPSVNRMRRGKRQLRRHLRPAALRGRGLFAVDSIFQVDDVSPHS